MGVVVSEDQREDFHIKCNRSLEVNQGTHVKIFGSQLHFYASVVLMSNLFNCLRSIHTLIL